MSHSFTKIWIHAIWSTKERFPLVEPKFETQIYDYMRQEYIKMGCPVRIINGMPDHIHCLFLLSAQKSIATVIKQVKGSSSHFINEKNWCSQPFAWQKGYAAYAVSESVVQKVFEYIKNQKQHHQKRTFQQEHNEFLSIYGLEEEEQQQ